LNNYIHLTPPCMPPPQRPSMLAKPSPKTSKTTENHACGAENLCLCREPLFMPGLRADTGFRGALQATATSTMCWPSCRLMRTTPLHLAAMRCPERLWLPRCARWRCALGFRRSCGLRRRLFGSAIHPLGSCRQTRTTPVAPGSHEVPSSRHGLTRIQQ
jgi:hypothetical protein